MDVEIISWPNLFESYVAAQIWWAKLNSPKPLFANNGSKSVFLYNKLSHVYLITLPSN